MLRSALILAVTCTLAFCAAAAHAQNRLDVTGTWSVTASGQPLTMGGLRLQQSGSGIVGDYRGGHIDGAFKPGTTQVDGTWGDARGNGWLTMVFSEDGRHFSGQWGFPARNPSGAFVGSRYASPPAVAIFPLVRGVYVVHSTGGTAFESNRLTLRQLGTNVVGNFGRGTQLSGTLTPNRNALWGTWTGLNGNGWIRLRFAPDSRSFQGEWGAATSSHVRGTIAGHIPMRAAQLSVRGVWDIVSSGDAFAARRLSLRQHGEWVSGTYGGGHMSGTLPPAGHVLTGRWRDTQSSGSVVLRFSRDGRTFDGSWTGPSGDRGSLVGRRVFAASPALR